MAQGENQKLKMLYLVKIFEEQTDEQHALTMAEIAALLQNCGVHADRKTLYQDFESLRSFGFDIICDRRGRQTCYYLGNRIFELPELKMLVDSVQAAKFITDAKSRTLIKKLESFSSRYDAWQLDRQVFISGRVKTSNKKVYYSVDKIHTALSSDRQITFHYFQWDVRKKPVLRHGGDLYHVSPWCLTWDDEYYYLVAFDEESLEIRHYRVDKMLDLSLTALPRNGKEAFRNFDMARYSKQLFGMYGGEETVVTLEGDNDIAYVLIDRFGKDIYMVPKDGSHFTACVRVIPGKPFLGWIASLEGRVRVTGPASVLEKMRSLAETLQAQYLQQI